MTTSPTLIHVRFFILPGIRPIRTTPSMHRTLIRLAPSMVSTMPRTSLSFSFGVLTLITSSVGLLFLLLFLYFSLTPLNINYYCSGGYLSFFNLLESIIFPVLPVSTQLNIILQSTDVTIQSFNIFYVFPDKTA